jgi:hypothetical protein
MGQVMKTHRDKEITLNQEGYQKIDDTFIQGKREGALCKAVGSVCGK